jgi:predicted phosphate transport protein (TIGR00153 family)
MSLWSWISRRRREDLLRFYVEHVDYVVRVVEESRKVIDELAAGNAELVATYWNSVFELERRADEVKRRILAELASEAFHPIDREEIVRLVLTTDDVAAYAKAWSRRAVLYLPERVPEGIGRALREMAAKVEEAARYIRRAVEHLPKDPRSVLEIANAIEGLEEAVDDIRHDVFREILRYCERGSVSRCLLLKEIMDSIENAADRCEDVADVLRGIALLGV